MLNDILKTINIKTTLIVYVYFNMFILKKEGIHLFSRCTWISCTAEEARRSLYKHHTLFCNYYNTDITIQWYETFPKGNKFVIKLYKKCQPFIIPRFNRYN